MSDRLAIFACALGASFIDRHIREIVPGKTVAVGTYNNNEISHLFPVSCPLFLLDRWALRLPVRFAKRAGMREVSLREAAVSRFLRRHHVAVVLGESLDFFVDFVPMLERMGLPYIAQAHGVDVSAALRDSRSAERYLAYKSARAILTRCELHKQRLIALGLPQEKIHVNYGGVDVPPELPRRSLGARKRFLAVSFFVPKKGPIYMLEAFRRAAAQDYDITLDVIGGGPLAPAMTQFVDACGLRKRVHLHGVASEETKRRLLRECSVFVQHSITDPIGNEEGLPAAIQEAMAHGMAVVSTLHAGIPEAVIEGETGFLVEERDVEGMAAALLKASKDAFALGEAGYRRACSHFTAEQEKQRLVHWLFDAQAAQPQTVLPSLTTA